MANYLLRELAAFRIQHGDALLSCMQIAAYNFHLGLLRPEPCWLDTAKSTRFVARPTVVMTSVTAFRVDYAQRSATRHF